MWAASPGFQSRALLLLLLLFFFFLMFIYLERERGRERILSRLRAVSTEPNTGLELTNCESMT